MKPQGVGASISVAVDVRWEKGEGGQFGLSREPA